MQGISPKHITGEDVLGRGESGQYSHFAVKLNIGSVAPAPLMAKPLRGVKTMFKVEGPGS